MARGFAYNDNEAHQPAGLKQSYFQYPVAAQAEEWGNLGREKNACGCGYSSRRKQPVSGVDDFRS
jgi:hypothetical protein